MTTASRPYRRRELVCPVERCGRSFHADDAAAAATHVGAAHTVCSCGWVGVSFSTHLGKRASGQVCELHHRTAVVRTKTADVIPIRRTTETRTEPRSARQAPRPRPVDVVLLDTHLEDLASAISDAVEDAHTEHHGSVDYPAAWERCWAEPCRSLGPVVDDLSTRAEEARRHRKRAIR